MGIIHNQTTVVSISKHHCLEMILMYIGNILLSFYSTREHYAIK